MEQGPGPKSKPERRRRRRPAVACVSCRRSKIRCDRKQPCQACIKSRHKTCIYESQGPSWFGIGTGTASCQAGRVRSASAGPGSGSDGAPDSGDPDGPPEESQALPTPNPSLTGPGPGSGPGHEVPDVQQLMDRIFALEQRLGEAKDHPNQSLEKQPERRAKHGTHNSPDTIQSYLTADLHSMSRSVMSKTRYFGQSHWMNGIMHFRPVLQLFEEQSSDTKAEARAVLMKCKALARTVKAKRVPEITAKYGTTIPPRVLADQLVDGYLRTMESVFRILHVPSFRREYGEFWTAPGAADPAFVIQLQLVLAIGSSVHDDGFSLRRSACQWVYEAEWWLLGPVHKSRLTLAGLQVMLLLTLGRQTASVGGDLVWLSCGTLLRTAIYMGLHRDPDRLPRTGGRRDDAELRRRLWSTVLELELQCSIDAGGSPGVSLANCDTRPPANLDDDQLLLLDDDDDGEGPPPVVVASQPPDVFTDMSVALALRATYHERLAAVRLLNDIVSRGGYEDTLRVHGRLSAAYKTLTRTLRGYGGAAGPRRGGRRGPSDFQLRFVEFLVRRYFLSLHIPYLEPSRTEPAYAFSKNCVLDAAVRIYQVVFPPATHGPWQSASVGVGVGGGDVDDIPPIPADGDDLMRLNLTAGGFVRAITAPASMLISLEVMTALQEDDDGGGAWGGPPAARPDLVCLVRHHVSYNLGRIKAGETNVKGFLFAVALCSRMDALLGGRKGPARLEPVLAAAMKIARYCYELLREQAGGAGAGAEDAGAGAGGAFEWNDAVDMDANWSPDGSLPFFDFTYIDSILGSTGVPDLMSTTDPSPW